MKNILHFLLLEICMSLKIWTDLFILKTYTENFVSFHQISFVKSAFSILINFEDYD